MGGICGATLGLAIWKYLKQKPQENETDSQSLKKWTLVGRIQKLVIYPVKSCPGIEVETATVTRLGLVHECKVTQALIGLYSHKNNYLNMLLLISSIRVFPRPRLPHCRFKRRF